MATVKGNRKKAGEDWESLSIRKADNGGFIVTKSMPQTAKGPYVEPKVLAFTEPGATLAYLEDCLGKTEHEAHEKSEGEHEKSEAGEKY